MQDTTNTLKDPIITFQSSGQVLLNIPDKSYRPRRSLGYITNGTLTVTRKSSKHYFRIYKGYAFCYSLMAYHQDKFNMIIVMIDGIANYVTPQVMMSLGIAKRFNDLELQIILPVKHLATTRDKALEYDRILKEKNTPKQETPKQDGTLTLDFARAV